MPGRLFLTAPTDEVADWLGGGDLEALPARHNIKPGQEVIIRTSSWMGLARWGLIPVGRVNARGRPVMDTIVNARSETVFDKSAFDGVSRAVVPASGWYEWTGEARRKVVWRIAPKDGGLIGFAAIHDVWQGPGEAQVGQVATITCAPNNDLRGIHHRMGVLLRQDQIETWLNGTEEDAAALMAPYPDGNLKITEASDVDWQGS